MYQDLATQTGGQVLETRKASVADVVKVINPVGFSNSSADLKEDVLLSVEESRAQYFSGDIFFVDIDSTLESLILILMAESSPALQITSVQGKREWKIEMNRMFCWWLPGRFCKKPTIRPWY